MSFWKNLIKYGSPVLGSALGSIGGGALGIAPWLGGAIGGGLGGVLGSEFGGKGGVKNDLIEGGLGALGGGLAGNTLAGWAGTTPGVATAAAASPGAAGTSSLDDMLFNLNELGGASGAVAGSVPAAIGGAASGAASGAGGGIMDFLKNNPTLATLGIGLGGQLLAGGGDMGSMSAPNYPAQTQLTKQAKFLGNQGMEGAGGKITPAAQIALNDATASIKSSYANMGLSGSSMEAQDLAAAKERAISASVQQGLQELGLSSDLYSQILGYQVQQDKDASDAITNLLSQIGYASGTQANNQPGA